eukprot:gb/GEZN01000921.1/.p1 GENE.gb/GEZN01000921.1/~~gb/GEZN01000921.1/.p1  ORF type:complete len:1093 (-),score=158.86 gb/GEZN01000921.1/:83-3361(-)
MEAQQKAYVMKVDQALSGFLATDQKSREQASNFIDAQFEDKAQRELFIRGLMLILRQSNNNQHRALASVFLRKKLPNGEPIYFDKLSEQLQTVVKSELLFSLVQEGDRYVRNQVTDTIAALADITLHRETWKELLPCLEKMSSSASATEDQRITALSLWGKLFKDSYDSLQEHLPRVRIIYQQNVTHPNQQVRFETLYACCKTIMTIEDPVDLDQFHSFAPGMLSVLGDLLRTKQDRMANRLMSAMVDIADTWAVFFRPSLTQVGAAMFQIGQNRSMPDGTRQLAMEWMCALCEREPAMARKRVEFVHASINLAFALLLCVEEDPGWATREEGVGDDDEDSNFSVGSEAVDRLAQALRAKKMLPLTFKLINELMAKDDWRFRHAALSAMAQVAEIADLKRIPVLEVINFIKDNHIRVRWAAMNCLGQLATDFAPIVQENYHAAILPALMEVLGEHDKPRLQKHALCTLCNVLTLDNEMDATEAAFIEPYVNQLMKALLYLLKNSKKMVQEEVVIAIAAVAGAAPSSFIQWYPHVVPVMKQIIIRANDKSLSMLRSRAMEAVTFIGMAAGKDIFRKDAEDIMRMFLQIMKSGAPPDDVSQQYMLKAWTRIAAVMGKEFAVYLPHVIPFVFAEARKETEYNWSQSETAIEVRAQERIFSSAVEDKAIACSMICSFVLDLQEAFFPYLQETVDIMVPLLKFYAGDTVRHCAFSIMPDLVTAAKLSMEHKKCDIVLIRTLFLRITKAMVECFKTENDLELLVQLLHYLSKVFTYVGPEIATQCLDQEALRYVGNALLKLLTKSHERIEHREEQRLSEDFDDEAETTLAQENAAEDKLNFNVSECMGALVKSHRELFLPTLDMLMPEILRMLAPESFWGTRKIALYIIVDVVEHLGPSSTKYLNHFIPLFLRYLHDQNPEIRQPCAYGLGVAAAKVGVVFKPFLAPTEKALMIEFKRADARVEMNNYVTDNVVSALGKMAIHQNCPLLLSTWLQGLPIQCDEDEAPWCCETLCTLLEQKQPALLGQNSRNVPKIMCVLGEVVVTERLQNLITPTLLLRMRGLLKSVKDSMSDQQLNNVLKAMPKGNRESMTNVLRSL